MYLYNSAALTYMYSKYCIWKTNTSTVPCLQRKMSAPCDFPMTAKSQTTRHLRPTRRIPTRPSVLLDWRLLSPPRRLPLTHRLSLVLYKERDKFFSRKSISFRFVPNFGIGSFAELGMPRNEHLLPPNNGNRSESIPWNYFKTKFRSQP